MKKLLSIILTLVICISMICPTDYTYAAGKTYLSWSIKDGVLTVSGTGDFKTTTDSAQRVGGDVPEWTCRWEEIESIYLDCNGMTTMRAMFAGLSNAVSVEFGPNFNTSSVTSFMSTFQMCYKLETIDASKFDMSKAVDIKWMFGQCTSLKSIDLGTWDTSKVGCFNYLFAYDENLESVNNFNKLNIASNYDFIYLFVGCKKLQSIDLTGMDFSTVTNMPGFFYGCESLSEIKGIEDLDMSSVTNIANMFRGCVALTNLPISKWNTQKLHNMGSAFEGCTNLKDLDLSNWNLPNLWFVNHSFDNCTNLTGSIEIITNIDSYFAYTGCFTNAATADNAGFTVYYSGKAKKSWVEKMISTKSENSKIYMMATSEKDKKDEASTEEKKDQENNTEKTIENCTHSKTTTSVTKKASKKADGSYDVVCSDCNKVIESKTINKIKTVKLSKKSFKYNGKAKKPSVVVKDSKGKTISSKNYKVTYKNNKKRGKATAIVKFKNKYSGTVKLKFTIK